MNRIVRTGLQGPLERTTHSSKHAGGFRSTVKSPLLMPLDRSSALLAHARNCVRPLQPLATVSTATCSQPLASPLKQAIDLLHLIGRQRAELQRRGIFSHLRHRAEARYRERPLAARPEPRQRALRNRAAI